MIMFLGSATVHQVPILDVLLLSLDIADNKFTNEDAHPCLCAGWYIANAFS